MAVIEISYQTTAEKLPLVLCNYLTVQIRKRSFLISESQAESLYERTSSEDPLRERENERVRERKQSAREKEREKGSWNPPHKAKLSLSLFQGKEM